MNFNALVARNEWLGRSRWEKVGSPREGKRLERAMREAVVSFFKAQHGLVSTVHARMALELAEVDWKLLTQENFGELQARVQDVVKYAGPGLFVERNEEQDLFSTAVNFLMGRQEGVGDHGLSWRLVRNVLLSANREFLDQFKEAMQEALTEAYEAAVREEDPASDFMVETFVNRMLGFFPFCYPEEGATLQIPRKVNGEWQMVEYRVDRKFQLTPAFFSSPIPAYGLVSEQSEPIIAFPGTTYPGGEGFIAGVLGDFTPGMGVGQFAYHYGKREVREWLDGKEKAELCGISLGGALALQFGKGLRDRVSKVNVFVPAGDMPWRSQNFEGVAVRIYSVWNDLVSELGYFPEGDNVEYYRMLRPTREMSLRAHARGFAGSDELTIFKIDPAKVNRQWRRHALTAAHISFSFLLFVPAVLIQAVFRVLQVMGMGIAHLARAARREPLQTLPV